MNERRKHLEANNYKLESIKDWIEWESLSKKE